MNVICISPVHVCPQPGRLGTHLPVVYDATVPVYPAGAGSLETPQDESVDTYKSPELAEDVQVASPGSLIKEVER